MTGVLAPLARGHSRELFALIDASREHLSRWLPWVKDVTGIDDTAGFIARAAEQEQDGKGTHYRILDHGVLAGVAGFHPIDWKNRNAEIGYWLGKDHIGRGLATMACRELLSEGFCLLDLNRIEIRCASGNARSIAVALRLGMTLEGTLREEEYLNGSFMDHHVFSILKREYSIETDQKEGLAHPAG